MKWIKHQTATRRDEKVARLISEGGEKGMALYGLYWMVQEIIAEQMEGPNPNCSVSYPISVWSHLLVTRGSLVVSTLSRLGATGLVTVERDGCDIRVTNRKLLKYRDEYSRKSGHDPDKVAPDIEQNRIEEEKEKHTKEKVSEITLPEWLPLEAWNGWLEVRKKKKDKSGRLVPWTERCATIALGKLERWKAENYDLTIILDAATSGNWQGLYLPKDDHGQEIKPKTKWRRGDPNNPEDWAAATIIGGEILQ